MSSPKQFIIKTSLLVSLVVLGASACGSAHTMGDSGYTASIAPRVRQPNGEAETRVLAQLQTLNTERIPEPTTIDGQQVLISPPYHAASGKLCRNVTIAQTQSLACLMDQGWNFVPRMTHD